MMLFGQKTVGDKLYNEGLALQKQYGKSKQQAAILKFKAAKVAYAKTKENVEENTAKCDKQIKKCEQTIKRLQPVSTDKKMADTAVSVQSQKEVKERQKEEKRVEIQLFVEPSRLDFKAKPKSGFKQDVKVTCNVEEWSVVSQPDWITVYTANGKIAVEASSNDGSENRSGLITVRAGDKVAQIIVNQDKKNWKDKVKGFIKNENS